MALDPTIIPMKPDALTPSPAATGLIKRFEGLRLVKYADAKGLATIGYGHRLAPGEQMDKITAAQADTLLGADLGIAAHICRCYVHVKLTQPQFDALTVLIYNIGAGAFHRSTLRDRLNSAEYRTAATQMLSYDHIDGIVSHGLQARRVAEMNLFLEGTR